jgi:tRNA/tmRNA/rRNA uracil-C5-methylase (TrmA/RlmC/RlmD family)
VTEPVEGDRFELTVGPVAHGGHCVARIDGTAGRVVFVRHALPGERVVAEVTEVHRGYLRADVVAVFEPSVNRVEPPCPYARPGACGGCDLQHATPAAQLEWKAAVVCEQLTRLARLTPVEVDALGVRVTPLPGGPLGWRTRVRYAVDAAGRPGLLKHRSHEVVPIDFCRIAHLAVRAAPVTGRRWPGVDSVEVVASAGGEVSVLATAGDTVTVVSGPTRVRERATGREWTLDAGAFWQVHPAAAQTLADAVVELLRPRPGESAWDLYAGAGLFAAALAIPLGPTAQVTLVEAARASVLAARANLSDLSGVTVAESSVEAAVRRRRVRGPVDLVVLDPPRAGAGATVVRGIVDASPRAVAYVACDPAAFARDVRTFAESGWRLSALRAYDCFPMTQHIECVGLLVPPSVSSVEEVAAGSAVRVDSGRGQEFGVPVGGDAHGPVVVVDQPVVPAAQEHGVGDPSLFERGGGRSILRTPDACPGRRLTYTHSVTVCTVCVCPTHAATSTPATPECGTARPRTPSRPDSPCHSSSRQPYATI